MTIWSCLAGHTEIPFGDLQSEHSAQLQLDWQTNNSVCLVALLNLDGVAAAAACAPSLGHGIGFGIGFPCPLLVHPEFSVVIGLEDAGPKGLMSAAAAGRADWAGCALTYLRNGWARQKSS